MNLKKLLLPILVLGLLAGCGQKEEAVWETVGDASDIAAAAEEPRYEVHIPMPEDAQEVFSQSGESYYEGDGMEFSVEVLTATGLDELLENVTGRSKKELDLVTSSLKGLARYDLTWVACGEEGDETRRCAILDDGMHYYVVTVSLPTEKFSKVREHLESCFAGLTIIPRDGIPT